jgi:hemolysin activation/secretion protein
LIQLSIALAAALSISVAGRAQVYNQIAPKTLPPALPSQLPASPEPAPVAGGDDRVLIPVLRGIAFLGDRNEVRPNGLDAPGVHISGISLLETADFRALVAPYLGRPLSLAALNRLTRDVVLYFRGHNRPIVDVLVPEQNIQTGTVQILVIEGRLGVVKAEGNHWFTSAQITGAVRARPGGIIDGGALLEDLSWLNVNPFRQVDLVYSRGAEPATTDVILRTIDRRPWRAYVGYEDSGNDLTGNDRVLAGVNLGDLFGREQLLNYQLTASPDFRKLVAQSASYVIPLPQWRHTLTFFGSYATSRPDLPGGVFSLDGKTWQASARYRVPIHGGSTWSQAVSAGLDFKRSNNNLAFGGTRIFAQSTDIAQALLIYEVNQSAGRAATNAELTVALSPGGLTSGNHTSAFLAARSFARADYSYVQLALDHTLRLPADFSWITRGTAQVSNANLLGSEQLGFGGYESLRGYDERIVNGDDGVIVVNELRSPAVRVLGRLNRGRDADGLVGLVFVDAGVAGVHQPVAGEARSTTLASSGIGIRYTIGSSVSLRADYGWQLRSLPGVTNHSRGHIGVTVAY